MKHSPGYIKYWEILEKVGSIKQYVDEISVADLATLHTGSELISDVLVELEKEEAFFSEDQPFKAEVFQNVKAQMKKLSDVRAELTFKPSALEEGYCPWCLRPLHSLVLNQDIPPYYCDHCTERLFSAVNRLWNFFGCEVDLIWEE